MKITRIEIEATPVERAGLEFISRRAGKTIEEYATEVLRFLLEMDEIDCSSEESCFGKRPEDVA
jgi:hypothetical protein